MAHDTKYLAIVPLAPIGSRIVFLGSALVPLPVSEAELGMPWNWRIGPVGRAAGDAINLALAFTPQGRGLRPWSPVRIKSVWQGSGDISTIKDNLGATELSLVGYSGGAAIAVMIAAQRDDVAELVTVAGNLDHQAWTSYHRLAPLSGSLNAADYAQRVAHIPQRHFIGERDSVSPPSFVMHWPEAFTGPQQDNIHIIADFDHGCCWERNWPVIVSTP